jgi:hypothetical protein
VAWALEARPAADLVYVYGSYATAAEWSDSDVDLVAISKSASVQSVLRHDVIAGYRVALETLPHSLFRSTEIFPPTELTEIFFGSVKEARVLHGDDPTFQAFQAQVSDYPRHLQRGLRLYLLAQYSRSERNFRKFAELGRLADAQAYLMEMVRNFVHLQLARARTYKGKDWLHRLNLISPPSHRAACKAFHAISDREISQAAGAISELVLSEISQDIEPISEALCEDSMEFQTLKTRLGHIEKFDLETLLFKLVQINLLGFENGKFHLHANH